LTLPLTKPDHPPQRKKVPLFPSAEIAERKCFSLLSTETPMPKATILFFFPYGSENRLSLPTGDNVRPPSLSFFFLIFRFPFRVERFPSFFFPPIAQKLGVHSLSSRSFFPGHGLFLGRHSPSLLLPTAKRCLPPPFLSSLAVLESSSSFPVPRPMIDFLHLRTSGVAGSHSLLKLPLYELVLPAPFAEKSA